MAATPLDRDQFAVTRRFRYLNHASMGSLPRTAADAGTRFVEEHATGGGVRLAEWEEEAEVVRARAAQLLGVPVDDVAFVKNTTEGLAFVANGLTWSPGDRVLVPDREFPTTVYPWLALRDRGVEVDLLEPVGAGWTVPLECIDEHLRTRPARLVAISWVHYARGWRTDLAALAALCHRHGALLCVDAIQGVGVVPADFEAWGVDFATADAYKWMLGPLGTGVLYVAERHRNDLRPLEPGWASVAGRDDFDHLDLVYADSARRFEGGSLTIGAIVQMGASIDLLLESGVAAVWRHVEELTDHLAAGLADAGATVLSDRSAAGRSAIVSFAMDGHDPGTIVEGLRTAGVVCSARGGGVRVSPHGYTTVADVDDLLAAVRSLRTGRSVGSG